MFDFIGVGILVLLAGLMWFVTRRAWGIKRAWLKWLSVGVSGLLALAITALLGLALYGFYRLNVTQPNPVVALTAANTPEQIARGQQLAGFCKECHSPNGEFPMTGRNFLEPAEGADGSEGGAPPIGSFYAPTLTQAHLQDWSDGEIVRAIREGVGKDGRAFVIMPSEVLRYLSDEDALALVAFLRSQPTTAPAVPESQLNALGAIMAGAGMFPFTNQPPITAPIIAPPAGTSAEYGDYLASIMYCELCHGANLGGLTETYGPPPGPNLTKVVPQWTEEQFITFFRTGQIPQGAVIGETMPWEQLGPMMSDDDLKAMYAYINRLPVVDGP